MNDPSGPEETLDPPSTWRAWILFVVLLVIPGALYAAVPVPQLTRAQVIPRYRRSFDPRGWFRKK